MYVSARRRPVKRTIRKWWSDFIVRLRAWFLSRYYQTLTIRKEAEIPQLVEPSYKALERVRRSLPDWPPDVFSVGIMRGGEAVFVKHNGAIEVFIGKNYDHAATKCIEWARSYGASGIKTSKVTKMNRRERRAYKAHYRKEGRKER
jgi:hypothetical protein